MATTAGNPSTASSEPSVGSDQFDPWKIAKSRFLRHLDDHERVVFDEATLENLYYTSSNCQKADRKDSKIRAIIQKVQPLVSAVLDYGSALDAFANIAPLYLAPIWGTIRITLAVARNYGKFYDRIADTFGRIGDLLPRFRDYQRIFDGEKYLRLTHAISTAYLDIIVLCTEFTRLLRGHEKSHVKRFFQPHSPALNSHLDQAISRFREHRKTVEKEAEVCHMLEQKEARDLVLRNEALAKAREREARRSHLVSQVSNIDYQYKHRRMRKNRHPNTGGWFVASSEFKNWLSCESSSMLSCYGIPGCGKSVLVSSIIDRLLLSPTESHESTNSSAYYYCDYSDKRTLTCATILNSVAQQLLKQLGEIPDTLLDRLETIYQQNGTPELKEICILLLEIVKRSPGVILFVDGLDEANDDERNLFLESIKEIMAQCKSSQIKLFISAREQITNLRTVAIVRNFRIHIAPNSTANDIDGFVRETVRDLVRTRKIDLGDPTLEEEICAALIDGAEGMFLWVKFQLDELCKADTDMAIRNVLLNLPRDLAETYDRLLSRIDLARQRYIQNMFQWIIFAKRPLTTDEFREAISFSIDDKEWDATKIPNDLLRLVRACGNLIVIDEDTSNVHLAHYTVQQYLLDKQTRKQSSFHTNAGEANWKLAELCVAYLSFSDFETQIVKASPDATANLAALEKAVSTQPMLPPNATGVAVIKMITRFQARHTPTNIEFARHLPSMKPRSQAMEEKYCLLSYVTEHWLSHTNCLSNKATLRSGNVAGRQTFDNLILDKVLMFQIRPWENLSVSPPKNLPYMACLGWALTNNHIPLLEAILAHGSLLRYMEEASKFAQKPHYSVGHSISEADILRSLGSNCPPDMSGWGAWVYARIVHAVWLGNKKAIKLCLKEWITDLNQSHPYQTGSMAAFLIFEATVHQQTKVLAWLYTSSPYVVWHSYNYTFPNLKKVAYGALEVAALLGYEEGLELLRQSCTVSESFAASVFEGEVLEVTAQTGDTKKLKGLLKVLSVAQIPLDSSTDQPKPRAIGGFWAKSSRKPDLVHSTEVGRISAYIHKTTQFVLKFASSSPFRDCVWPNILSSPSTSLPKAESFDNIKSALASFHIRWEGESPLDFACTLSRKHETEYRCQKTIDMLIDAQVEQNIWTTENRAWLMSNATRNGRAARLRKLERMNLEYQLSQEGDRGRKAAEAASARLIKLFIFAFVLILAALYTS
ncbi:hypothetical protein B0J14DRAFT_572528 [Halenospora varia]|nr:hypothetical protein B0J14DRAFT_572528 [Halenospora varia]